MWKTALFFGAFLFIQVLKAELAPITDQFLLLFSSSGHVLYKVLDFANDHGFRYLQILSYHFQGFDHAIHAVYEPLPISGARRFHLKDGVCEISFLCFLEKPEDQWVIDLEIYRPLLEEILQE